MRCICYIIIALIRLPEKVKFSNNIQPVRMPTTCNLSKTVEAIAMGYGDKSVNSTDKLNNLSRQLMFAELITLPTHVCREMLSFIFRDSMICAANELKKQSIFSGDSGGPIVMSGNHTLIGISSAVNIGTINLNLYNIVYSSFQYNFHFENRKCGNWRTSSFSEHLLLFAMDQNRDEFRFTRLLIVR